MRDRTELELPALQRRLGDRLASSIRCVNCGSFKVMATSAVHRSNAGFGCGCLVIVVAAFFTAGLALLALPLLWGGTLFDRLLLRTLDPNRNRTDCTCAACGARFWLDEHPDALTR